VPPSSAPDPTLARWARQVKAGDVRAFEALFRHLHPMLTRVARQIAPSDSDAADAVQETFVRFWETRDRIDPDRSVSAYLARSVRNRLLNASRDAKTRQQLRDERADDLVPYHPPRPDEAAQGTALADHLRHSLEHLPDRQRTAITLTRFDGLSHAEAADVMGCSARTVNNHIVRGLRTLRDRLQAYAPHAL
jgi:RNA polymerase sigma-70 factor (ECF subfamily)